MQTWQKHLPMDRAVSALRLGLQKLVRSEMCCFLVCLLLRSLATLYCGLLAHLIAGRHTSFLLVGILSSTPARSSLCSFAGCCALLLSLLLLHSVAAAAYLHQTRQVGAVEPHWATPFGQAKRSGKHWVASLLSARIRSKLMRFLVLTMPFYGNAETQLTLRGAGATLPQKLYVAAAKAYSSVTPGVNVEIIPTGSGNGKCLIKNISASCGGFENGLVIDWAASDATFSDEEYAQFPDLQVYPVTASAIVPVSNLPGLSATEHAGLVLDTEALAAIFCSSKCTHGITHWDDPRIVLTNPVLNARGLLVHERIRVVVRGDGSGSSEIFRGALSGFSAEFRAAVGVSSRPTGWPQSHALSEGGIGLVAYVLSVPYSIGYTVLSTANDYSLPSVRLSRGLGPAVEAALPSISLAVSEASLSFLNDAQSSDRLVADLEGSVGESAWPITGFTYIAIRTGTTHFSRGQSCASRLQTVLFWKWFFQSSLVLGLEAANGFASLPVAVRDALLSRILRDVKCRGQPVYSLDPLRPLVGWSSAALRSLFVDSLSPAYAEKTGRRPTQLSQTCCSYGFSRAVESAIAAVQNVSRFDDEDWPSFGLLPSRAVPESSASTHLLLPLFQVAYVAILSLCGATVEEESACGFDGEAQFKLSPHVLALLLDEQITRWDDARLVALNPWLASTRAHNQSESVVVVGEAVDSETMSALMRCLAPYKSDLRLAAFRPGGAGVVQSSDKRVRSYVLGSKNAIGITPFVSAFNSRLSVAAMQLSDHSDGAVNPSPASIAACASTHTGQDSSGGRDGTAAIGDGTRGCYPLSDTVALFMRRSFSGAACAQRSGGGKSTAEQLAQLAAWLHGEEARQALSHYAALPAINASVTEALLSSITCDGISILAPPSPPPACPVGLVRVHPPVLLQNVSDGGNGSLISGNVWRDEHGHVIIDHVDTGCAPCPFGKFSDDGLVCVPKTSTIGVFLPPIDSNTSTWSFAAQIHCAADLAREHVNHRIGAVVPELPNRTSSLRQLRVDVVHADPRSSLPLVLAYQRLRDAGAHAIVGSHDSATSAALATLTAIDNLPQCSYGADAESLSNKLSFPFFARTHPSLATTTVAIPHVASLFNWSSVGVLFVNDDDGKAFVEGLAAHAGLANVGVAVTASYEAAIEATYSLACAKVKAAGVNIVFATVLQSDLVGLMQAAESASLWGEGYAWVLAQHMNTDALVASASAGSLSRQSVVSLLDGLLTFVDSPRHSEGFSSFSRAIANSSSLVCARIKAAIDGTEDSMSSHSVTAGAMVGSEMDGEIGEHSLRRVSESHRDGGLAGLSQMDSEMTNQSLLTGNMTGRNSLASEMGSSMNYDHSSHLGAPVALRKEAAYAYDCVAALAMALAHAPSPSDGNGVFDALLSGGFEGASALVAFDPNTADRATSTVDHVLHNWVPSDSGDALLELYKDHFSLARGWAAAEPAIRWPGGVFTTPLDHTALPPCEINHIRDLTSGVPRCVACSAGKIAVRGECVATESGHTTALIVSLSTALGLLFLAALCIVLARMLAAFVRASKAAKREKQSQLMRVRKAMEDVMQVGFSVCYIKFSDFSRLGWLQPHEEVRKHGMLEYLDDTASIAAFAAKNHAVFISHQWLGSSEPDPQNIHYKAICTAVHRLCSMHGLNPNKVYVWVDYLSIPQKNAMQKRMSIDTIALYATSARFFVVVAPPALHCDKGTMCNAVTYSRRGWCRLEQWARLIAGGVGNMFIFDGTELMQFAGIDKWLKSAVHVYDGEFACDSDRVNLVDTVIGLWSLALLHRDSAEREKVISLVQEHRESVFPVKYFGSLLEILERDVLNLGAEVEASPRVRQDEGLEQPNHTRVCMDDGSFSQESSPQITRPWQAISRISFVESVGSPQIPRRAFLRANTTNVAPRSPTKGRSSEWPMA